MNVAEQASTATWLAMAHQGAPKKKVITGVATITMIAMSLRLADHIGQIA